MLTLIVALSANLRHVFSARIDLLLENAALRQQLVIYQRSSARPRLTTVDRLIWILLSLSWLRWRSALLIVQPATVVGWHRHSWKRYWAWKSRRSLCGRPRFAVELRELIMRMARENPLWGAQRIRGELLGLGFEVGRESVRRYMHQARRRPPSQTWRTFLENHAPDIWACDFFTVPTLSFRTLYVFFIIEHGRRKLVHVNVTRPPNGGMGLAPVDRGDALGKAPEVAHSRPGRQLWQIPRCAGTGDGDRDHAHPIPLPASQWDSGTDGGDVPSPVP